MIINLTGQPGAGKTTIAKELIKIIPNSINIDGDEIFLEKKGFVPVISLISPFNDLREGLKLTAEVLELYIYTTETRGREHLFVENYEIPENAYHINTTLANSVCESSIELIKIITEHIQELHIYRQIL